MSSMSIEWVQVHSSLDRIEFSSAPLQRRWWPPWPGRFNCQLPYLLVWHRFREIRSTKAIQ